MNTFETWTQYEPVAARLGTTTSIRLEDQLLETFASVPSTRCGGSNSFGHRSSIKSVQLWDVVTDQ